MIGQIGFLKSKSQTERKIVSSGRDTTDFKAVVNIDLKVSTKLYLVRPSSETANRRYLVVIVLLVMFECIWWNFHYIGTKQSYALTDAASIYNNNSIVQEFHAKYVHT